MSSPQLPIDILIGADIAYDVSLLTPLSLTISSVMSGASESKLLPHDCRSYLVETGNCPLPPTPALRNLILLAAVRWKDIYQWFLESLTTPSDEAGPGFKPLLLERTVELFKKGAPSSVGDRASLISLSADSPSALDLESSFSRADVILHIFTQQHQQID